ncbi:MAG: hypothetical protein K6F00_08400 [Lachnospiraceae bacterium]|nr:hypothetical protein [Lachnospiraceae bacterium]
MSIKRLKLIRRYLTERREIYERVEVQKAIKLLDEEIGKQDRSSYFKKYYKDNRDQMLESHREWLKNGAKKDGEDSEV